MGHVTTPHPTPCRSQSWVSGVLCPGLWCRHTDAHTVVHTAHTCYLVCPHLRACTHTLTRACTLTVMRDCTFTHS